VFLLKKVLSELWDDDVVMRVSEAQQARLQQIRRSRPASADVDALRRASPRGSDSFVRRLIVGPLGAFL
jgi:hypothetical protein